jgi:putative aminopeptidase FrvX
MNLNRLETLSSIAAPSGYEDEIIKYIRQEMLRFVQDVKTDRLGNLISFLPGSQSGQSKPVMIFAHMDELGFIVRKIEEGGFIRLERLGGVPERTAPSRPVIITGARGPVQGVIGHKSHHFTQPDEKYVVIRVHDLYIDVGARSRQAVIDMGISVGDPVTYAPFFHVHEDAVMAKSIDNRAGCEVLLSTLEKLSEMPLQRDIYFVATTQEEFNLRGVIPTYSNIKPEIAIAVDVVVSCDTPDLAGISDTRLGSGPAISLYTFHGRGTLGGLIPNRRLVEAIVDTAEKHHIPYQKNISMGLLTDTSFFQIEGDGVLCLDIGIPTRYTHAPIEVASLVDIENVINLLTFFVSELPPEFDFHRG